jgi:CheY-like chemotaxis protein
MLEPGPSTILLVEDELMVRKMLLEVLQTQGYQVLEACNGQNALEIARKPGQKKIDLLLTDLVMPKMDGLELVRQFSPEFPETRIILMSGYTEDPTFKDVISKYNAGFISKPFLPLALGQKIEGILNSKLQA